MRKMPRLCMCAENAVSEDRAHDLRIMGPTRYQLRYCRLASATAALHLRRAQPIAPTAGGPSQMTLAGLEPAIFGSEDQRLIH